MSPPLTITGFAEVEARPVGFVVCAELFDELPMHRGDVALLARVRLDIEEAGDQSLSTSAASIRASCSRRRSDQDVRARNSELFRSGLLRE